MTHPRVRFTLSLVLVYTAFAGIARLEAAPADGPATTTYDRAQPFDATRVQGLVDECRTKLSIASQVSVALVDRNPLMASVTPDQERPGMFLLSLERSFAESLSADELVTVIAHELGHVWIFTHHPYLQTESLANRVAMRMVTRERLEQVYTKVWQRAGEKGSLARFMGPASPAPAPAPAPAQTVAAAEPIRVAATPR
jgi:hypothetical protein